MESGCELCGRGRHLFPSVTGDSASLFPETKKHANEVSRGTDVFQLQYNPSDEYLLFKEHLHTY